MGQNDNKYLPSDFFLVSADFVLWELSPLFVVCNHCHLAFISDTLLAAENDCQQVIIRSVDWR